MDITNKTVFDVYPAQWLKPGAIKGEELTLTIKEVKIETRDDMPKAVLGFEEIPHAVDAKLHKRENLGAYVR